MSPDRLDETRASLLKTAIKDDCRKQLEVLMSRIQGLEVVDGEILGDVSVVSYGLKPP